MSAKPPTSGSTASGPFHRRLVLLDDLRDSRLDPWPAGRGRPAALLCFFQLLQVLRHPFALFSLLRTSGGLLSGRRLLVCLCLCPRGGRFILVFLFLRLRGVRLVLVLFFLRL